VPDNARNIEELVARAREADAALAAVREGAQPAGDPDPYRVPSAARDESADGSDDLADGDSGDDDPAAGDFADVPPAARSGENDHLAETPAPRPPGAGYSRS